MAASMITGRWRRLIAVNRSAKQRFRTANCLASVVPVVLVILTGCVTEFGEGQEPLRPQPVSIPDSQPPGLHVEVVQVWPHAYLKDTNNNRVGDCISTIVYFWTRSYKLPITGSGTLRFELYKSGTYGSTSSAPVREWVFESAQLAAHVSRTSAGDGYYFELSLLGPDGRGQDDLGMRSADLVAAFFPNEGTEPITSRVSTILLQQ